MGYGRSTGRTKPAPTSNFRDIEPARSSQTVHSASTQRSQAPPEILRIVFQQSLPSSTTLERSIINAPELTRSEEYEVKRTIVAVCKLWRDVGLELLYDEVVIRRVDSLSALLRTLVAPSTDLGKLIKKFAISCVVPFGDDLTVFEQCVKCILAHCPCLIQFTIHPSFHPISIDTEPYEVQLRPLRVSDDILNITHLDWGYWLLLSDLISLLPQCPNLKSLRFHLRSYDRIDQPDVENALSNSLVLPNLRELHFIRSDGPWGEPNRSDTYVDSRLAAQWSMPRLERFTYGNTHSLGFANIVGFCQTHGGSLRYLHLSPDWREWILNDTVQKVIDECPLLEHLVLWMSGDLEIITALHHRKLMWMDVWLDLPSVIKSVQAFAQTRIAGLPFLCRMRVFDNRLWRSSATELPALLPPEAAAECDGFEYSYFGLNIKLLGHLVFQMDQTTNTIFEADDGDDDEGSDFDPDNIPSYDDTSEGWGSSSECDTSSFDDMDSVLDLQEELQEWQADPQKALAVFSSDLEFLPRQ
ncbi:hypothetical protein PILCRDRAFT_92249 [Piloderma croceum F 1598]|uniref:F-box domain-containing protein n=1 Tax=Piloderma croceum (strain F 1598) TaxID=765440 RepID=A0A0C3AMP3_PILCF|nr:hypothetical protein PILCRDRAFT_92249 [Piloderma croceum F 1598]